MILLTCILATCWHTHRWNSAVSEQLITHFVFFSQKRKTKMKKRKMKKKKRKTKKKKRRRKKTKKKKRRRLM